VDCLVFNSILPEEREMICKLLRRFLKFCLTISPHFGKSLGASPRDSRNSKRPFQGNREAPVDHFTDFRSHQIEHCVYFALFSAIPISHRPLTTDLAG
jgi:hypothetical protein